MDLFSSTIQGKMQSRIIYQEKEFSESSIRITGILRDLID